MEKKNFSTEAQELAFLKQWLSHDFPKDEEYQTKNTRYLQLSRKYSERELAPFMKELGRARAGTLQHIVREIFSIPQRKLVDKEIYRRMEGKTTPNFKYLLIAPFPDELIMAAKALADRTILKLNENGKREDYSDKLKSEILSMVRSNPPHFMIKEILAGQKTIAGEAMVPVAYLFEICQKHYPELPIIN